MTFPANRFRFRCDSDTFDTQKGMESFWCPETNSKSAFLLRGGFFLMDPRSGVARFNRKFATEERAIWALFLRCHVLSTPKKPLTQLSDGHGENHWSVYIMPVEYVRENLIKLETKQKRWINVKTSYQTEIPVPLGVRKKGVEFPRKPHVMGNNSLQFFSTSKFASGSEWLKPVGTALKKGQILLPNHYSSLCVSNLGFGRASRAFNTLKRKRQFIYGLVLKLQCTRKVNYIRSIF